MSPTHLHSDPVQVFDVEQHQPQDPVGSRQGVPAGPTDIHWHASATPTLLPPWACLQSSPLTFSLGSLSLSYTTPSSPSTACFQPLVPSSPNTPRPSLHVLNVASSHSTHRDS